MDIKAMKKAVEKRALALGVTDYEVFYKSYTDISVETLNREISNFNSSVTGGVSVRLVVGGRVGYASSERVTPDEVEKLVDIALENAKYTDKPDEVGIFEGNVSYSEKRKKTHVASSAEKLKNIAISLADKAYSASEMVKDGTATAAGSTGFSVALFNSKGLELSTEGGMDYAYCEAIVEKDGESQFGYSVSEIKNGEIPLELAEESVSEALSKIGAMTVTTGKYNVVIDGKEMRSLLSAFAPAFSAKNAQTGMSLLAGKEGERIASELVTLTDDPMREELSIGTFFDAEGVSAARKCVIEKGVLKTLLHNRETAKKAGIESTGNASKSGYSSPIGISPYAFCIEGGDKSFDELMSLADGGLLVTEIKGLHAGANAVTGDFSIESAGYMIKDGKAAQAVRSFTISGNFFELLKSITAISDKIEFGLSGAFTTYASPAVLVENMSVAGE